MASQKGYGWDAFIGWGEEAVYGTQQASAMFAELVSESLAAARPLEYRAGLRNFDWAETNTFNHFEGAAGGFIVEGNYEGLLRLLEHCFGDSSGATSGSDPYTHEFTWQDTPMLGKGLTLHVRDGLDSTNLQTRYPGFKINQMRFSFDPTRPMQVEVTGVGGPLPVAEAVETPTFPDSTLYVLGSQVAVEVNDVAEEFQALELVVDNGLNVDKRILGSKNIIEPARGATRRGISGTLTMDMQGDWRTRFLAGTTFKLEVLCVQEAAVTEWNWEFLKCLVTDHPWHVTDGGLVQATVPFQVIKPTAGEAVTCTLLNTESAIA